jgi:flavin-dependent dehydrogenase
MLGRVSSTSRASRAATTRSVGHAGRRRPFEALAAGRANDELIGYENLAQASEIGRDLKRVRNAKPLWSKFGTAIGVALGGLDMWTNELFGFSFFGTMKHGKADATLKPV